jgi:hypothetical protein
MNSARAREFFSDHLEGTLDEGLKQAFERALANDEELRQEYREFAAILRALPEFQSQPIAVPPDLHHKIIDRVMPALDKRSAGSRTRFGGWLWAGAAAVAIGAAAVWSPWSQPGLQQASVVGAGGAQGMRFENTDGVIQFVYPGKAGEVLVLTDGEGAELTRVEMAGELAEIPLVNRSRTTRLVTVELQGKGPIARIVLPGSLRQQGKAGYGSEADLARMVATATGQAVILEPESSTQELNWLWKGSEPIKAVQESLSVQGAALEQRSNGMYLLSR